MVKPGGVSRVLVLDTETTGLLDSPLATVVEVAAAALEVGDGEPPRVREVDAFLVNPGEAHLGPEADEGLAVSGITREELRARGLAPRQACARLTQVTQSARAGSLACYGVFFDPPMLARPPLGWTTPLPWVDVMATATEVLGAAGKLPRRADGTWKWASLKEAALFFGVVNPHPHRARADAVTAAWVLAGALKQEGAAGEGLPPGGA